MEKVFIIWINYLGIDSDDLMASGKTDGQGQFSLKGHTEEFTTIDPKLNIYHDCEDGIKVTYRVGQLKRIIPILNRDISSNSERKRLFYFIQGVFQSGNRFPMKLKDFEISLTLYRPKIRNTVYIHALVHPFLCISHPSLIQIQKIAPEFD